MQELEQNFRKEIIFVSDFFFPEILGGAELSFEEIISSIPKEFSYQKIKSSSITEDLILSKKKSYWIFGNFSQMPLDLIPVLIKNQVQYSIVEFDFKSCVHRSPQKCSYLTQGLKQDYLSPCTCTKHPVILNLLINFFKNSMKRFWMSEKQLLYYRKNFNQFSSSEKDIVLSSLFSKETISFLKSIKKSKKNNKYAIFNTENWLKSTSSAVDFCVSNKLDYDLIKNSNYLDFLRTLSEYRGIVYLPVAGDTCPRLIIESKLLDLEIITNENVLHRDEEWFNKSNDEVESYLLSRTGTFWSEVIKSFDALSISGYTTTFNCFKQEYPIIQCIESMLGFCDEVIIADSGSTDGTVDLIQEKFSTDTRVKLFHYQPQHLDGNWALNDGLQKSFARSKCTMNYCWQMDCDELVHEDDYEKIKQLCHLLVDGVDIVSLPVVEYWGSPEKVRLDIHPIKWRLSRNDPNIIHGIPLDCFVEDERGQKTTTVIPLSSDGCDMIFSDSGERVSQLPVINMSLLNKELISHARNGNFYALKILTNTWNDMIEAVPPVYHYGWYDISRKIKLYRDYWQSHWSVIWGNDTNDNSENNMFFDCPWSEVTDDMIDSLSKELSENCAGWIWHRKWDKKKSYGISLKRNQPLKGAQFYDKQNSK